MEREGNAPELIDTVENIESEDVSRAVDRLLETDRHRKRTLREVPTRLVDSERHLARARRWSRVADVAYYCMAALGFLAFAMEVWRTAKHGWP